MFRFIAFAILTCQAQPLRSLKTVPVPQVPGLDEYVRDRGVLVALGKAFFWDMQAGSDGRTACASCHFHAGADHRRQNQIQDPNHPFPANLLLESPVFPLRKIADPTNRNSTVLTDTEMRIGSAGLFRRMFKAITEGEAAERGDEALDAPSFAIGDLHVRRVTARNSPSVLNAVFYERNFWDGRAQRVFNGLSPNGAAPGAWVIRDGRLERQLVGLDNSSLASQATGPILDDTEMSYAGRTWPQLARKIYALGPLAFQTVAGDDSALGPYARIGGRGLRDGISYLSLVQAAFQPKFWEYAGSVDDSGFTQAEQNFPLFWGLALQAYQSTLISNDSPFDRFMEGDQGALTAQQREGMQFFQQQGRCTTCHGGAEFSNAVVGRNNNRAFQRTGVRPAGDDQGSGNGNFKSIGLRNIELTGPYFHNGGQSTLEQVVDFYARGGDFANNNIRAFNASGAQRAALVAFMKSLTDDRVRFERAPFDHPELCLPDGHVETRPGVLLSALLPQFPRASAERWAGIAATGASGNKFPLQTFDELLNGVGNDGSRVNTMTEPCTIPLP